MRKPSSPRDVLAWFLGALFVFAGAMHFVSPDFYLEMMPDWVPAHGAAVAISGIAEVVGGLALIGKKTAGFARWWLIALLVAVFPANIQAALDPDSVGWVTRNGISDLALWLRLPFQAIFIWLVWVATAGDRTGSGVGQGDSSP